MDNNELEDGLVGVYFYLFIVVAVIFYFLKTHL